jgi:L-serine/L-threonine ammonia-lyase
MRGRIALEGAQVIAHGKAWDDAHAAAMREVSGGGAVYIPPFDHPSIWRGNSTLVDELAEQAGKPGLVVTAVGGGGLLCGVLEGLHRRGWKDVPVLACETEGTASFAAAFKAGKLVTLPEVTGAATCLAARTVTAKLLDWFGVHPLRSFVTGDAAAVGACVSFLDDHRFLVEPACGAALAAVYGKRADLGADGPIVVIVCGGAAVTATGLAALAAALPTVGANS